MPTVEHLGDALAVGRTAARSIRNHVGDTRWHDDLEQEAMIGAYRAFCHGVTDERRIYRAARTHAIDFLRLITHHRVHRQIDIVLVLDEPMTDTLTDERLDPSNTCEVDDLDLTVRERQVGELLALGYGQRQIGAYLGVSESRICQVLAGLRARFPDEAVGRRRVRATP